MEMDPRIEYLWHVYSEQGKQRGKTRLFSNWLEPSSFQKGEYFIILRGLPLQRSAGISWTDDLFKPLNPSNNRGVFKPAAFVLAI